ncbi:MAG: hypothetical protein AAB552_00770 [Patescibacteria group bacterium]
MNKNIKIILTIAIFIIGVWTYGHSKAKDNCRQKISYYPARETPDFMGGISKESAYFQYFDSNINKFESREEAMEYCISGKGNKE